jgi:hypothetical protein
MRKLDRKRCAPAELAHIFLSASCPGPEGGAKMVVEKGIAGIDPIDVMIVIDTSLAAEYDKERKSTKEKPATCTKPCAFMIAGADHAKGSEIAKLSIKAVIGSTIRFTSVSVSNQLDHAVFVYDFQYVEGAKVLDARRIKKRAITHLAVQPIPSQMCHRPPEATFAERHTCVSEIGVTANGTGYYNMRFVVYDIPRDSERPVLGYFQAKMKIKVKSHPRRLTARINRRIEEE